MKYFLSFDNSRNTQHAMLYIRLLRKALGDEHEIVLVGHHFVCTPNTGNEEEDLKKINEFPSADTVLFDHEIMRNVFGEGAIDIMRHLASVPVDERDSIVEQYLNMREGNFNHDHAKAE